MSDLNTSPLIGINATIESIYRELGNLIESRKTSQMKISSLEKEKQELNAILSSFGKRLAEIEAEMVETSKADILKIKEMVSNLIQDVIKDRNESASVSISDCVPENGTNSSQPSCGGYFYKKISQLGVDVDKVVTILARDDTFVVGDLVLEALLGQDIGCILPIRFFVTSQSAVKIVNDMNHTTPDGVLAFAVPAFNPEMTAAKYVKTYSRAFCRNYFDGKTFFVGDFDAVKSRTHRMPFSQEAVTLTKRKMESGRSYADFGFTILVSNPLPACQSILPYDSPHLTRSATSGAPSSSQPRAPKASYTVGKGVNPLGLKAVPAGASTMLENFNALCERHYLADAVKDIVAAHAEKNIGLVFTGRFVDEAVLGERVGPAIPHLIVITNSVQKVVEIARNSGLALKSAYAPQHDFLRVREYGTEKSSVKLLVVYHPYHCTSPDIVLDVRKAFPCHCSFEPGELFRIHSYVTFREKIATNHRISTRDLNLTDGVALCMPFAKTLAYFHDTMYDRLVKDLAKMGFASDLVDDILTMPKSAIVGRTVRRAMCMDRETQAKHKHSATHAQQLAQSISIVVFDPHALHIFLDKHSLKFPGYSYTRNSFVSNQYAVPGEKDGLVIEIITPIGDFITEASFVVDGVLVGEYHKENCVYFDGSQFHAVFPGSLKGGSLDRLLTSYDRDALPLVRDSD